jgi:hypothetical protein
MGEGTFIGVRKYSHPISIMDSDMLAEDRMLGLEDGMNSSGHLAS